MPGKGRKRQRRARKGTGSIYYDEKRKLYVGQISLGVDASGKRIRRTFYGKTEGEVQELIDKAKQDARSGLPVLPEKLTVADHFRDWLRAKKADVRASTYTNYETYVTTHILPALGHHKIRSLDYRMVNAFYETLEEKGLSARTIAYIAKLLRMGLEDAVRKRLIAENPARLAAKRSAGKKEARYMNQEEVAAFLKAAKGERLEHLFVLLLHTGLRPGEALGLPWDAVDLEARTLTVKQALHEVGPHLYLGEPKTSAARRTISLPNAAVAALKAQWKAQREEMMAKRATWRNADNLVFTDREGGYLRRTNIVRRDLKRIRERVREQTQGKIDLEGVTLHTFRHTHASMLIFAGVDIKTVSRRLGHESITITLETYGHLLPGQDERAAAAMDTLAAAFEGVIGSK